jgi:hypothetical protein
MLLQGLDHLIRRDLRVHLLPARTPTDLLKQLLNDPQWSTALSVAIRPESGQRR